MEEQGVFSDLAGWLTVARDVSLPPVPGAAVGFVLQETFDAQHGDMMVWRAGSEGVEVARAEYRSGGQDGVAVLMVGSPEQLSILRRDGARSLPTLVRRGGLRPFILQTPDALEASGMSELIEDLGLVFPKH